MAASEFRGANATNYNTSERNDQENNQYETIIDRIQFTMAVLGFVGNVIVYITLSKNGYIFTSPTILRLLKNQSVADSIVCLLGSIFVMQPSMWTVSNEKLSAFICMFWHGQFVYWSFVVASIYNLVVLAFERYLAICYPFKHKNFVGRNVTIAMAMTYVNGMVANCLCLVQVSYRNGECTSDYYLEGNLGKNVFKGFGTYILIDHFLFPAMCFMFLYGRVVYTLSKRRNQEDKLGTSRLVNQANKQLTRTCIVVTVIFILSIGYDLTYYFLGRMGFVRYIKNDFLQKLGLFFSIFNSMANPFVYTALMNSYRKAMAATFCWCRKFKDTRETSSVNTISTDA